MPLDEKIAIQPEVDDLRTRYSFRTDDADLTVFLLKNDFLVALLKRVSGVLEKYLPSARFSLRLLRHPDSPDDEQIVVLVLPGQNAGPLDADAVFQRFEDEWWLDNLHLADGKVCIVLQFR